MTYDALSCGVAGCHPESLCGNARKSLGMTLDGCQKRTPLGRPRVSDESEAPVL